MALTDNLVSYYKLDETSGTTVTDSHGSNDGTNSGATVGETGKINTAYDFDGTDDKIVMDSGFSGDTTISASVWFKTTSTSGFQSIICLNNDGQVSTKGFHIEFDGDGGTINAVVDGIDRGFGTTVVNDGNWHFAVITRNSNTFNIYLDGNSSVEATVTAVGSYGAVNIIGDSGHGSIRSYFDGSIDEVAIFDTILSSTEITELYNSGDGLAYPFLEAPVADFSATPLTGERDLTIAFTDSSTNTPTSWFWDFGDDNTSTLQNPSHTYYCSGKFTVSLTATNSAGSDEEEKIEYIVVTDPSSTITVGSGSIGSKYIATNYPVTEGLIAGTTKQTTNPNLVATEEDSF